MDVIEPKSRDLGKRFRRQISLFDVVVDTIEIGDRGEKGEERRGDEEEERKKRREKDERVADDIIRVREESIDQHALADGYRVV